MLSAAFSGEGENHLLLATDVSEEPFLHLPDALNLPEDFSCHVPGPILQSFNGLVVKSNSPMPRLSFLPLNKSYPTNNNE